MFKKKESKAIANRLTAIKNAPAVQFSELQQERKAKPRRPEREQGRKSIYKHGLLIMGAGEERHCVVRDINDTGAKIVLEGSIGLAHRFKIVIDGYRAPTMARLAWQNENEAGVIFE